MKRNGLHTRPLQWPPRPIQVAATPVHWRPHPSAVEKATEPSREDRAALRASILERQDGLGHSFKENLRHHPFVFVIEKMAVKDRHASDYGVGEIHNDVDRTAVWNIHGVQPQRIGNWSVVLGVSQEMHLMDVHGMQLSSSIDNPPMLICPDLCAHHGSGVRREYFSVDVKALLVFRERHDESRRSFFFCRQIQCFKTRFEVAPRRFGYWACC